MTEAASSIHSRTPANQCVSDVGARLASASIARIRAISTSGSRISFPHEKRVRICANKVVAGVRCSTLLPNIRSEDAHQSAAAQQISPA